MITNLGKLLTVQLPPILTLLSASLILANFLSPVPIQGENISLMNIAPVIASGSANLAGRQLPRAAAVALVERAAASANGPTLTFGLLGKRIVEELKRFLVVDWWFGSKGPAALRRARESRCALVPPYTHYTVRLIPQPLPPSPLTWFPNF